MRKFMGKSRFEDADDWAYYVLSAVDMDAIAKALDHHGWMIVVRPEIATENLALGGAIPRCPMDKPSADCPSWADNGIDAATQKPRPQLVVNNDDTETEALGTPGPETDDSL